MSMFIVQLSGITFVALPPFIWFMLMEHSPSLGWVVYWSLKFSRCFNKVVMCVIAFIPRCGVEPCAVFPFVVIFSHSIPRCAVTIWKFVGSGMTIPAMGGRFSAWFCMKRFIPQLSVSSPAVAVKMMSPFRFGFSFRVSAIAAAVAAIPAFMSVAPRPRILPSFWSAENGSNCHFSLPGGTTSRCAAKRSAGFWLVEAMCAVQFALELSQISTAWGMLCESKYCARAFAASISPLLRVESALMRFFKSCNIVIGLYRLFDIF